MTAHLQYTRNTQVSFDGNIEGQRVGEGTAAPAVVELNR